MGGRVVGGLVAEPVGERDSPIGRHGEDLHQLLEIRRVKDGKTPSNSCGPGPSVDVVQAAQDRAGHHSPMGSDAARKETLQAEAAMRPVAIVVAHELLQHRKQVTRVDHDQVVEALGPNCPHDPLGDGVGGRRPRRCPYAGDAQVRQLTVKVTAVNGIPVVDEVLGLPAPGRRLQELPPDPSGSRAGGDVKVDQLSPLVADKEEDVEGPEGHGLDDKQIGCPNASQLTRQERSPALVPRRPRLPPAVSSDGAAADGDAELQQLSPDALGSPTADCPGRCVR